MSENQHGMRRAMAEAAERGNRSQAYEPPAPRPSGETNAQLVARAGRALYGADWQSPLARALELQLRTVQRIAAAAEAGQPYPVAPGVLTELSDKLRDHSAACAALASEISSFHGS